MSGILTVTIMHRLSLIDPLHPKNEITVTTTPNETITSAAFPIDVFPNLIKKIYFEYKNF